MKFIMRFSPIVLQLRGRLAVIAMLAVLIPLSSNEQSAPAPEGPLPNARQIEWYHREMIAFFHFGMNTFTDVNEGDGKASTQYFNPGTLDCNQWVSVLKNAGITTAIIVAKHADGFCNWPSAYTDYSVRNSPWKNGKGDVVKEFTDACRLAGVKAGIYLGPYDRHDFRYGTPAYADYYANQLSELLATILISECGTPAASRRPTARSALL